jgi:hypothetical protein
VAGPLELADGVSVVNGITNLHTSLVLALKGLYDDPAVSVPTAKFRIEETSGVRIKNPTKKKSTA